MGGFEGGWGSDPDSGVRGQGTVSKERSQDRVRCPWVWWGMEGQGWLEDFLRLRSSGKWGSAGGWRQWCSVRRGRIPEAAGP